MNSIISDLSNMVRIPSVNPFGGKACVDGAERAIAEYYEARLEDLGLEVGSKEVVPGRRNVWGRLKGLGGGPTIVLAGHLDTVGVAGYQKPFEPFIKNGRLYGRGSCDMKAGLAAYLEVVRQIQSSGVPLKGDLIVVGIVDEEHTLLGSADFGKTGPKADFALIAEPTNLSIACAHKGQINATLRTYGQSAHSSMPELGENAIMYMAAILEELRNYTDYLAARPNHALCGKPKFSAGVIRGGTNVSSVPDLCELEIDRRMVPGESLDAALAEIRMFADKAKGKYPSLKYELLPPSLSVNSLDVPTSSPLVQAMLKGYLETLGHEAEPASFPGATDAPNFGCPTVICGPGALVQAHSLEEYVSLDEIEALVRIYVSAIRTLQDVIPGNE